LLTVSPHQLVVEVAAGVRHDDLHLAPGRVPALATKLDSARARVAPLAEDAQPLDAIYHR
jgi:hypothetical protein